MANKIMQKILEKKTKKQKQNKNKHNVILKKKKGFMDNFMSKIKQRGAEHEIPICVGLRLGRVFNSRSER